jgi:hypothetical protein
MGMFKIQLSCIGVQWPVKPKILIEQFTCMDRLSVVAMLMQ